MNISTCPKCDYTRQARDRRVSDELCPSCGIAYKKWLARQHPEDIPVRKPTGFTQCESQTHTQKVLSALSYIPEPVDSMVFWGRVTLYITFLVWGWSFILAGIDWESIGGSFLHSVILPFHEFGHVLFSPLGRFMGILGGSLFQVLMPLCIMFVFIYKQRDTFAATIMLWWTGQSFIDLSPYIADAPYRALPLIMGMGEEAHDWGNLLVMTNSLDKAQSLAQTAFGIGVTLMLMSFVWGGYLLLLQKQKISEK